MTNSQVRAMEEQLRARFGRMRAASIIAGLPADLPARIAALRPLLGLDTD